MPQNEYFTKMLKAKKEGAKSFTYNGNTYVQVKSKTGLIVYKKAEKQKIFFFFLQIFEYEKEKKKKQTVDKITK